MLGWLLEESDFPLVLHPFFEAHCLMALTYVAAFRSREAGLFSEVSFAVFDEPLGKWATPGTRTHLGDDEGSLNLPDETTYLWASTVVPGKKGLAG